MVRPILEAANKLAQPLLLFHRVRVRRVRDQARPRSAAPSTMASALASPLLRPHAFASAHVQVARPQERTRECPRDRVRATPTPQATLVLAVCV
jgi:hypothetical protein